MTAPNPDHLLDQASRMCAPSTSGMPRQIELRRAISAAYYAIFHAIIDDAASQVVGGRQRNSAQYSLVYRSVDHRDLRTLCENMIKPNVPPKYKPYVPQGGFAPELLAVARAVPELQEKRHQADYDPLLRVSRSDATLSVQSGRAALKHWRNVPRAQRRLFVLLLLFMDQRARPQ